MLSPPPWRALPCRRPKVRPQASPGQGRRYAVRSGPAITATASPSATRRSVARNRRLRDVLPDYRVPHRAVKDEAFAWFGHGCVNLTRMISYGLGENNGPKATNGFRPETGTYSRASFLDGIAVP